MLNLRNLVRSDKGTASSMKIETLVFVVWLVRGHEARAMRPHVAALLPAVLACVQDPFYKVTAEALRVLQTLVKVMRPLGQYRMSYLLILVKLFLHLLIYFLLKRELCIFR